MMYYLIIIFFALVLAFCFIEPRGVISYKILILLMFLLFAYVKTNVDMGAYLWFYDQIRSVRDITVTDPAFGLIMYTGKLLGLDYFGFLAYLAIIGLIFLTVVFRHYSKYPAIVLALYFIFDYAAETIQIRAFLAEIVMYILMMNTIEDRVFHWKRFFLTMLVGILLHSTSVFFILLLLPFMLKSRRKLILLVGICIILVPSAAVILRYLPIPLLRDKLQYYVYSRREGVGLTAVMYVMLFLGISFYIRRLAGKQRWPDWSRRFNRLLDIHIICMIACVLLLYFSSNFYRILRTVMVVDSIVVFNYFASTRKLKPANRLALAAGVFAFFILFELWTHSWYSVMITNTLFQNMMSLI